MVECVSSRPNSLSSETQQLDVNPFATMHLLVWRVITGYNTGGQWAKPSVGGSPSFAFKRHPVETNEFLDVFILGFQSDMGSSWEVFLISRHTKPCLRLSSPFVWQAAVTPCEDAAQARSRDEHLFIPDWMFKSSYKRSFSLCLCFKST